MKNPISFKKRSKSADLEADDKGKPLFNSLEQIDDSENQYRQTLKAEERSELRDMEIGGTGQSILKLPMATQGQGKPKFVIHNGSRANGLTQVNNQSTLDRKTINKNLKPLNVQNNNTTQKLPQMTASYLIKAKQTSDLKKTLPFTDVTNPLQNPQWKKLQQVKKTVEEKKALISQFESVNR